MEAAEVVSEMSSGKGPRHFLSGCLYRGRHCYELRRELFCPSIQWKKYRDRSGRLLKIDELFQKE